MKDLSIKFFSPSDNVPQQSPCGYIAANGNMVFPRNTMDELGIETDACFQIGTDVGHKRIKSLYLIPTDHSDRSFPLKRSGKGYAVPLAAILRHGGVAFEKRKHTFTASLFPYEDEGVVGFKLDIEAVKSEPFYPGKRRGPKPKSQKFV